MTFFLVSDGFHSDPQFLGTSEAAVALWTRAGSWSAFHLTDGYVPTSALPMFTPNHEQASAELVERGVWKRARGGFQFVDWRKESSRTYVEAKREAWRTRQQNYRSSQPKSSRRDTPVTHAGLTRESTPDSNRESRVSSSCSSSLVDRAFRGEVTEVDARVDEPPTRCPKHTNDDNPPPCGGCGDARRAHLAWKTERAAATRDARMSELSRQAQAKAIAVANCDLCDDNGYAGSPVPCDHNPDAPDVAARGRAAVAAAMGRKGSP